MPNLDGAEAVIRSYRERYVAFLDVLAFSNLVEQSKTDANYFSALLGVFDSLERIEELAAIDRPSGPTGPERTLPTIDKLGFYMFSDSICYTAGATPVGLSNLIEEVASACRSLMSCGVFVRGAIVIGDVYEKGSAIFGPALIDAYQYESRAAHYPRVVLSDEVFRLAEGIHYVVKGRQPMKLVDRFRKDFDGLYHLNWVRHFHHIRSREAKGMPSGDSPVDFTHLKKTIEWWLEESKGSIDIQAKWRWFAHYFNEVIGEGARLNILGSHSSVTAIEL